MTPQRLAVRAPVDIDRARRAARRLAAQLGFDRASAEQVALAASELATNLTRYAIDGELRLAVVEDPKQPGRLGVQLESRDAGPGIANVDLAMSDGYSTGGGLGSGLPSVRRLMDEFELRTAASGTHIVCRKWPASSRLGAGRDGQ